MDLKGCFNCEYHISVMADINTFHEECIKDGYKAGHGKRINDKVFTIITPDEYTKKCWCKHWKENN